MLPKLYIIVQGADSKNIKSNLIDSFYSFLLKIFFRFDKNNTEFGWGEFFDSLDGKWIDFDWSKNVSKKSIEDGKNKLLNFILEKSNEYEIVLVGFSLGAQVIISTLETVEPKVSKVVLIAGVYKSIEINDVNIFDFYSDYDRFMNVGKLFLGYGLGRVKGNNIKIFNLNKFKHHYFAKPTKRISEKKISIGDLIKRFL